MRKIIPQAGGKIKRKHRVIVEFTLRSPKSAVDAVTHLLELLDCDAANPEVGLTRIRVKLMKEMPNA